VALVACHLRNGFFIFRPGEGYEYMLMISVVAVALAGIGGGWLSLDHAAGLPVTGGVARRLPPRKAGNPRKRPDRQPYALRCWFLSCTARLEHRGVTVEKRQQIAAFGCLVLAAFFAFHKWT